MPATCNSYIRLKERIIINNIRGITWSREKLFSLRSPWLLVISRYPQLELYLV